MFRVKRIALTTFKHGRASFDEGVRYRLRSTEAAYFRRAGWMDDASEDDGAPFVEVADDLLDAGTIPASLPAPGPVALSPDAVVQKVVG